MNLRPAGGTLRPRGHILTHNEPSPGLSPRDLSRLAARVSGPRSPLRHVLAPRRAAPG